jgi:hypothetical protein
MNDDPWAGNIKSARARAIFGPDSDRPHRHAPQAREAPQPPDAGAGGDDRPHLRSTNPKHYQILHELEENGLPDIKVDHRQCNHLMRIASILAVLLTSWLMF